MADFYQNGVVTTLHNLDERPITAIEAELTSFSKQRPMGLILPSLFSELEGEALPNIISEIEKVKGINKNIAKKIYNFFHEN